MMTLMKAQDTVEQQLLRAKFFRLLRNYTPEDLKVVQSSYWLAEQAHLFQARETGEPYFTHVYGVAEILAQRRILESGIISAALLHDTPEDCFIPHRVSICLLGHEVWHWLDALSKRLAYFHEIDGHVVCWAKKTDEQYRAGVMALPERVQTVKLADRIYNQGTCQGWKPERVAKYAKETRDWILPMALKNSDRWFADTLQAQLLEMDRRVAEPQSSVP